MLLIFLASSLVATDDYLIIEYIENNQDNNAINIDDVEAILQQPEKMFSKRVKEAVYNYGMTGNKTYLQSLLPKNKSLSSSTIGALIATCKHGPTIK